MSRRDEWHATRLKYIADFNVATLPEHTDPDVSFAYVDISNVTQGHMNIDTHPVTFRDAPSRARRLATEGDTVVSTVRTYLRAVATVPASEERLVFSTGFAVLRPRATVNASFLSYYLQGDEFVDRVVASSTGVSYPAVTATELARLAVLLPTVSEQAAIAAFLDRETAKIDALIREQEGLVAVLRERREALITRAVTKGLNPEAPMRETGVASLGAIPNHWRVQRVKHLGRAIIGLTYSPDDIVDTEQDGTLVLRAGNIQRGRLVLNDNAYVSAPIPADLRTRAGDILICARNGSARLIGKNAVIGTEVEGETWGAFMAVLRSPLNFYLRWILNSQIFTAQIGMFSTSTINQLTSGTLHNLEVAVPPASEMAQIADYLARETEVIDTLIAEAEAIVEVARERRAALITTAVTGQIDVRGEVA